MPSLNLQLRHNPIAIIGMGAIMPDAHNLREFWNNVIDKVDCIQDVPASRWNVDSYYDPDPTAPDKTYCRRGGFIPDIDFDPLEFGLPPNILEVTDTSQMLGLVVAKEALFDAGYLQGHDDIRERTGVILGVGGGQKLFTPLTSRLQYPVWDEVLKSYGLPDAERAAIIERIKLAYVRWEENSFPGMLGNVVAGRIANRFDLGGTNCVVDAACASTMAALKMAVSELTEGRADMMLTGGADTDNSISMYMCFSKTPAFTKGSHPRPFDSESDGMMVGEGLGIMVLKRLEDAERDGDRIYAVIKGLGSSSDGRYKSIYAPRGEGQEKALRRAYEDAGFSPSTIGLVEAHGTGTIAGDTTEVTTIIRYFNQHDTEKQHIALGSVKSQIGHTKASAGAAGLIKTALALHHKVLPPTLNVEQPNPKFDMANSSFYINTETRPWMQTDPNTPRRAGVSSFGFGGTNFHVILEEYRAEQAAAYRVHNTPQAVILTGSTTQDLLNHVTGALNGLQGDGSEPYFLNMVRSSRQGTIPAGAARIGFVAASAAEALALLQVAGDMLKSKPDADEWQHPKGIFFRRTGMAVEGHIVALFSGQGSQYLEMGRELALNFPEMRDSFARIDALMKRDGKTPLSQVVYPRPGFNEAEKAAQETALQSTDYAQPAIGAISAGLYRLLQKAGFKANFTAGHSFGEVTALWAAGVLNDDDYAALTKARGAAMAPPASDPHFDAGTMMAVTGDVEAIEREIAALQGVQVANRNSRTQVVVAGSKDAIKQAEAALKAKGYKVVPLSVSAAFHTPLVGHAHRPFSQAIQQAAFSAPRIPVYSNASGRAYPSDPAAIRTILTDHILNPVLFRDEIEQIYAAGGTIFVEFGPRNVLTNLVKDILGDRPHVAVALNGSRQKDSDRQLREAAVQLQVLGLPLGTLDPYMREFEDAPKKKGLTIKVSGASYVSDKTRAAYRDALASGGHISLPASTPVQAEASVPAPAVSTVPVIAPTPVTPPLSVAASTPESLPAPVEVDMSAYLHTLQASLDEFREHQRETLRVHEQYAQSQSEYFRIFFDLTQQQQTLLAAQTLPAGAAEALAQNMLKFHEYQSETLNLHQHYMQHQTEIAQSLLDLIRQQYAALGTMPVPHAQSLNGAAEARSAAPRQTAPEPVKPAAVKTVIIPETPKPLSAPAPAAAATNGHPPVAVSAPAPVTTPVSAPAVPAAPAPTAPPAPPPSVTTAVPAGIDLGALNAAMLRVVGEKTGYPVEMLELSMDMEADLGIDSIKRVEILGAMRDTFPNLPQFSPEELGELRTLQQIVDYMAQRSGGAVQSAPAPVPVTTPVQAASAASAPIAAAPVVSAAPTVSTATVPTGIDLAALNAAMLRVVGEKTGYPVEMLELSMDMEADLGIDSIKRVEILGAMRDTFPNLPQFSPEELGELRTLQQIVDYMAQRSGGAVQSAPVTAAVQAASATPVASPPAPVTAPVSAPAPSANGINVAALSEAMLRVVGEKTGYPVEMLELSMDMEADLGIDSIKRVEILGAMRDTFPNLPQFSPEELGELRTLQQIVDYMEAASRQASPFDVTASPETVAPASASGDGLAVVDPIHQHGTADSVSVAALAREHGIERREVALRRLPAPDQLTIDPATGVCVITDDGTDAPSAFAERLTGQGWQVVVLGLPAALVPASRTNGRTSRVQLQDVSEAELKATLDGLVAQYGGIGAFIHLNPPVRGSLFTAQEKALVRFAFLMAKLLKPHLTAPVYGSTARRSFITLTRLDGAFGTTTSTDHGVISGGLFGLVKTLSLEWDRVHCRAVDVTPDATAEQVSAYLMAELYDPNRLLTEIAYGSQGRTTLVAGQSAPHTGAN